MDREVNVEATAATVAATAATASAAAAETENRAAHAVKADMVVIIDGQSYNARSGETILELARRSGIHIPTLCYHEALGAEGACRLCTVEIIKPGGARQLVASCTYPLLDPAGAGLQVLTDSPSVLRLRRSIVTLLYKRAPNSPFMQDLYRDYGSPDNSLASDPAERCILCRLCVRACSSLGISAISVVSRGTGKRVGTPYDRAASVCIGCGACSAICPTGAIEITDSGSQRRIWHKSFELASCENCSRPYATREQVEYINSRSGLSGYEGRLCETCRRSSLVRGSALPR